MSKAYFNYGILKFKIYEENTEYDEIVIGKKPGSIVYPKADRPAIFKALMCQEEREFRDYADGDIADFVKSQGIDALNFVFKGRGLILVSEMPNYHADINMVQNGKRYITTLDLHGKIVEDEAYSIPEIVPVAALTK